MNCILRKILLVILLHEFIILILDNECKTILLTKKGVSILAIALLMIIRLYGPCLEISSGSATLIQV
jgi:hypothetical protein